MFRKIKLAVVGTAILVSGFAGTAAQAATAEADVRARILRQVTVTNTADLEFGVIVSGVAASTVGVSTAGVRNCGAGLACSGTVSAAAFTVTGTSGQVVTVAVPASVSLSNGTSTMNATLTPSAPTILLDGTDGFTVGGTLTVGAAQEEGNYAAVFDATVDYQ